MGKADSEGTGEAGAEGAAYRGRVDGSNNKLFTHTHR